MAQRKISYTVRDFQAIRQELINYTRTYYPELIDNFNDASVFSVFLDLNAAVADNLHYHIDRSIQETVLQYAQQRSSIYNIARTYGLKIPGQRPSVALVDFSITVPAFGDKEDERYLGTLRRGSQVNGAGQVFETIADVNFASPFNQDGFPNRLKIPNFDANNNLVNYTITKRETVVNGITKVFKRVITPNDVRPFFEFFLPEKNVLGVTSIIQREGTAYSNVPTTQEFLSPNGRWYEVQALAEDRVFIADPSKPSDDPAIKVGTYIQTQDRFITEYTPEGFLKITFGGGTNTAEDQLRQFTTLDVPLKIQRYQNNSMSLGNTPQANTTIFIQYRIGGGLATNLGVNTITQIGAVDFSVVGPSDIINNQVINSLTCNNVTAAIGGAGYPSTEEVRNYITFNFAAQNRAVTIHDYEAIIRNMPGEFGAPAKVSITENNNKINVQVLSYDASGNLTSDVSQTLKQNLAEYLSNYRMINDYVTIGSAETIDLGVEVSVVLDSTQNSGVVISNVIDRITTFFNPAVRGLGENILLSELSRIIQSENGVISLTDISIFGKVGGQYSSAQTSMPYSDEATKKISLTDNTIFAEPSQIYQIRFPSKDIVVRVKNYQTTTFS
jgi:Baseplate J-like protein